MFEKNVGKVDKIVRVLAGIVLLVAGYVFLQPVLSYVVMLLGLIMLITAAIGSCALYTLLGINTAQSKTPRKK